MFAQERRAPPTVVVYGDDSRDWVAEVQRFADVLDPRDRPVVVAGDGITPLPRKLTLVWFGDLSQGLPETAGAPEAPNPTIDLSSYSAATAHLFEQAQTGATNLIELRAA